MKKSKLARDLDEAQITEEELARAVLFFKKYGLGLSHKYARGKIIGWHLSGCHSVVNGEALWCSLSVSLEQAVDEPIATLKKYKRRLVASGYTHGLNV